MLGAPLGMILKMEIWEAAAVSSLYLCPSAHGPGFSGQAGWRRVSPMTE